MLVLYFIKAGDSLRKFYNDFREIVLDGEKQRGWVKAPDFKSGGPGFKSRSDHLDSFHGSPVFKSKATMACLPPIEIFNKCYVQCVCLFHWFIVSPVSATALNTSTLK